MPKKSSGGNAKADAAREKKAAAAAEKQAKADKALAAIEDAEWAKGAKTSSKKAADEEKRRQAQARKAEAAAQLASEEKELAKYKPKPVVKGEAKKAEKRTAQIEKFNDSLKDVPEFSASNIDDAIDLLTLDDPSSTRISRTGRGGGTSHVTDKLDRHPERRAKAAYNAWLERELPGAKAENPGLRLSQLKELLWKQWQKSPENPLNCENAIAYNATGDDARERIQMKKKEVEERLRVK